MVSALSLVVLTADGALTKLLVLSNGVSGTGRAENHPLNLNRIMPAEESGWWPRRSLRSLIPKERLHDLFSRACRPRRRPAYDY